MMNKHQATEAKKNLPLILSLLCVLLITGTYLLLSTRQQKIGYVNSSELVNGYLGMKEARNQYQNQAQLWQANLDTLELDFNKAVNQYHLELASLSPSEKKAKEETLAQMQRNLIQYSATLREKAKKEDDKITQGVLNQVNSFVQAYGRQHGYGVILGTTLSGSLLYGQEQLDVTKSLLNELNQMYNPSMLNQLAQEKPKDENKK